MKRLHRTFLQLSALSALVLCFFAIPKNGFADFRVCNDTKATIGVALGYSKDKKWFTEGWWQIPGQSCGALFNGDLGSRYYYLYAEDSQTGGQWRGNVFMCAGLKEFKIEGIDNCFERGFEKIGFIEIDTGNKANWMVRLNEEGQTKANDN